MWRSSSLLWLVLATSLAAPADDPVHVDLPVYDQPGSSSDLEPKRFEPENSPGLARIDKGGFVGGLLMNKLQAATGALASASASAAASKFAASSHNLKSAAVEVAGGLFSPPVTTLEGALLESEGLGSKKLSIKDNLHHAVAGILQPKAIVDTIKEEDKYGNDGDKFYAAGRAVVGGAEGISNFVNSALEVPGNIIKRIARIATEKLNNLGGKLIGL